jgi:hypothetical protein
MLLRPPTALLSLRVFSHWFGFACLLRPGVPAPGDEDGHIAASSPSFISPGRDAHLFSVSSPSLLLHFSFELLNLLSRNAGPVAVADMGLCGIGLHVRMRRVHEN